MGGGGGLGGAIGGVFGGIPGALFGSAIGGGGGNQGGGGGWGLNDGPAPVYPGLTHNLLDNKTGLLHDKYQLKYGEDINPNTQGIEAIRSRALGTGPSAWQTAALGRQGLEEQGLKNAAQQQGASAEAQGRSALASKYGLSPAAQERLAKSSMRDQMSSLQGVGAQGAKARADLALQDEQMKNQFLQGLPGQENALAQTQMQNRQNRLGTEQYNLGNTVSQFNALNAADINKYNEQMKAYAAQQQANAMHNSGGSDNGGMFGNLFGGGK